jgi:SAM-dependent methyltransferase
MKSRPPRDERDAPFGQRSPASYAMPAGSSDRWPEDYERGRPGWPPEVVEVAGLDATAAVLEIGAGTGKLTRLLLPRFTSVTAIEPADAMRRLLQDSCPSAVILSGTAEAIPLAGASIDGLFVAEAFHKFDASRAVAEFERVLRPGGVLVLMWNVPAGPTEPSIAAAEQFLTRRAPPQDELGYVPTDLATTRFVSGAWRRPFATSLFDELHEIQLPNPQMIDRAGLVAFFASMGWIADLPDDRRSMLLAEVSSLLPADEYSRHWTTRLYTARRSA